MSITYQFARRFEGRPVMAHCRDGRKYYGVISRVTPDAVHIQPFPSRAYPVSNKSLEMDITTADEKNVKPLDISESGYGYGYGGYGRYGYGGYGYGPGWAYGAGIVLPLYVLLALSLFWW